MPSLLLKISSLRTDPQAGAEPPGVPRPWRTLGAALTASTTGVVTFGRPPLHAWKPLAHKTGGASPRPPQTLSIISGWTADSKATGGSFHLFCGIVIVEKQVRWPRSLNSSFTCLFHGSPRNPRIHRIRIWGICRRGGRVDVGSTISGNRLPTRADFSYVRQL